VPRRWRRLARRIWADQLCGGHGCGVREPIPPHWFRRHTDWNPWSSTVSPSIATGNLDNKMCCKAQRQYWHAQTELLTTPQQAHGVRSNQPSALMEPSQYALREIIGTGHGHRV